MASLALSRAIFPRAPRLLWAWTIPAGVIADVDAFSAFISPVRLSKLVPHLYAFSIGVIDRRVYFQRGYRVWASRDLISRLSAGTVFVAVVLAAMAASRDGCGAMARRGVVLARQPRTNCKGLAAHD